MGSRLFSLQTSCELPGWLSQVPGMRNDGFRCRLIIEVRVSTGFENVSETREFYSADFISRSETSTEPVVFAQARDFISASSCSEATGSQVEIDHQAVRFCCVILKHFLRRTSPKYEKMNQYATDRGMGAVKPGDCNLVQ